MEDTSIVSESCHTCFDDSSKFSLVSIMLGMTVCFSTLWRFPYQLVNFGGASFLLVYLVLAVLFVYPALTAEWGLGRLTGRGPDGAYNNVKFPGSKYISAFLFFIVIAIGSYFAVWIGWIIRYAYSSLTDPSLSQVGTNSEQYFTNEVVASPWIQLLFTAIVILLVAPTVLGGTKKIQSLSNKIVPVFYLGVVVMTTVVLLQPGVFSTTLGYFTSIELATQVNAYTFVTALGQAFFSLCLGGTFMVLYGSYMRKKEQHNIPTNAGYTVVGNTLASVISAVLVIGVIALAGMSNNIDSFGPGLFFGVIPEAFQIIGGDMSPFIIGIIMSLFFVMFFFAAYLPMTAILEVTTVSLVDSFNLSRSKAFAIIATTTLVLGIPSMISPLDGGFLYNLDIFVGAMGLVIGSMLAIIAFMWYVPKNKVLEEVNTNSKLKLGDKWYVWTKYFTPLFMIMVVLYVLSDVVSTAATSLNGLSGSDYILYDMVVRLAPFVALVLVVVGIILYQSEKSREPSTVPN